MLAKLEKWTEPLRSFLFAKLGEPFAWGICDCHTLVLEAVDVMTGGDSARLAVGRYSGARDALGVSLENGGIENVLRSRGAYTVEGLACFGDIYLFDEIADGARCMPWAESAPAMVLRADKVVFPTTKGVAILDTESVGHIESVLRFPLCRR